MFLVLGLFLKSSFWFLSNDKLTFFNDQYFVEYFRVILSYISGAFVTLM